MLQDPVNAEQWLIFYHGFTLPATRGDRSLLMDTLYFEPEPAAVANGTGGVAAGGPRPGSHNAHS